MKRAITSDNAKSVINLLGAHQPLTLADFKAATRLRSFELQKLLQSLADAGVIIKESGSGVEKYWLNVEKATSMLGRDVRQRRRLKHPKKKAKKGQAPPDEAYR